MMIIVIDVIDRDSNVQLWLTQTLRGIFNYINC
jgi:hypothetical protein